MRDEIHLIRLAVTFWWAPNWKWKIRNKAMENGQWQMIAKVNEQQLFYSENYMHQITFYRSECYVFMCWMKRNTNLSFRIESVIFTFFLLLLPNRTFYWIQPKIYSIVYKRTNAWKCQSLYLSWCVNNIDHVIKNHFSLWYGCCACETKEFWLLNIFCVSFIWFVETSLLLSILFKQFMWMTMHATSCASITYQMSVYKLIKKENLQHI